MSLPITPSIIDACRAAGACDEGLAWVYASPRTLAKLAARKRQWAVWLATDVPALGDAEREELRDLVGVRTWWRDGLRHRDDGPAIERDNGTREWWRNDERVAAPQEGSR